MKTMRTLRKLIDLFIFIVSLGIGLGVKYFGWSLMIGYVIGVGVGVLIVYLSYSKRLNNKRPYERTE